MSVLTEWQLSAISYTILPLWISLEIEIMASIEMSVLTEWQPYAISYTILPLWISLWNWDNGQYRDVCTYRVTTICYILYNITIMINITMKSR